MTSDSTRYIHRYTLLEEETGELFTGLQNIVIIELPKMPKTDDGNGAWPVLECFRCKTIEEAEMHANTYPKVKEIVADLRSFSLVKEIRSAYDLALKAQRDRKMWQDEFHARGMEEGLQEGLLEGAAREREKWDAVRSENEAVRSKNEAVMSENEELRRELERLRKAGHNG
jgi:hypothetical protein